MFQNQRHAELLEILKSESFASVKSLSERLFASQPTIRRDLNTLEKQGYIRRSHGGAILADGKVNTPVPFRKTTRAKEKLHICRLAATLIHPDSVIFTDASTTVSYLSNFISESDHITVVTNGLPLCRALAANNLSVYSTGGRLLKDSEAFVGRNAEETVQKFNADLLFFSSSALDRHGMISDYSEEEISLRDAMHKKSEKTVFLIDSGKIGNRSAFCTFSLDEVDYVVTDRPLLQALTERYKLTVLDKTADAILYQRERDEVSF